MPFKTSFVIILQVMCCHVLGKFENKCGYSTCPYTEQSKLNVHLIPHSHDDLGWIKTVDQYLYGTKVEYQRAGVQFILDSVVHALHDDPSRRFIQVETGFFWMWWKNQNDKMKNDFKKLVSSGQIEIVGGGWSMNDEAVTNYQSIIDQFTMGFKTLQDTLGDCGRPKVGWQIDPFGHSREMASIFAQFGFDGVIFPRVHYNEVYKRQSSNTMEFIWRGSTDLGSGSDLFTSIMSSFYTSPDSFCWASTCKDEPIVDDKDSPDYNLEERVGRFAAHAQLLASYYNTKNVLIPMGGDFEYQSAHIQFKNMDRLIRGFKEFQSENINIIYSTPSCYIRAVNNDSRRNNYKLSVKIDDFLPYASDSDSYWTGFYTSRPNLKRYERQANNFLQIAKQLTVFQRVQGQDYSRNLTKLKEIMGIMQHHDAITGTSKQHVTNDYIRMVSVGMEATGKIIPQMIHNVLNMRLSQNQNHTLPFETCIMANVSRCGPSNADQFATAVYNPLGHTVSHYVHLPVTSVKFKIIDDQGNPVQYQVSPNVHTFPEVKFATNASKYTLVFRANDLPPLGIKMYFVYKEDNLQNAPESIKAQENVFQLGTGQNGFELDPSTGFLRSVTTNGFKITIKQEFLYYSSSSGHAFGDSSRPSGAYAFRLTSQYPSAQKIDEKLYIRVYKGPLFDEVHQIYSDFVKQIIRIYKDESHIEFDWIVGPLSYRNGRGVEVVSRFTSNLNSSDKFYTDSNGRGIIQRTRHDSRVSEYDTASSVPPNYYPVTSKIEIRDGSKGIVLNILNDRAQGGSSLASGEIELMVHRRCKMDDGFFVEEVLNEWEYQKPVVVRGTHYLTFGKGDAASQQNHDLAQKIQLPPWTFIANTDQKQHHKREELHAQINFRFSGLLKDLPTNVKLLTLEPWDEYNYLLRLEHTSSVNDHPHLAKPVTVDLKDLFTLFQVTSATEMTLGANQLINETTRLRWVLESGHHTLATLQYEPIYGEQFSVILKPMEIRTFVIEVKIRKSRTKKEEYLYRDLSQMLNLSVLVFVLFLVFVGFNMRIRRFILRRFKNCNALWFIFNAKLLNLRK